MWPRPCEATRERGFVGMSVETAASQVYRDIQCYTAHFGGVSGLDRYRRPQVALDMSGVSCLYLTLDPRWAQDCRQDRGDRGRCPGAQVVLARLPPPPQMTWSVPAPDRVLLFFLSSSTSVAQLRCPGGQLKKLTCGGSARSWSRQIASVARPSIHSRESKAGVAGFCLALQDGGGSHTARKSTYLSADGYPRTQY